MLIFFPFIINVGVFASPYNNFYYLLFQGDAGTTSVYSDFVPLKGKKKK
jgi:hypothetical protein